MQLKRATILFVAILLVGFFGPSAVSHAQTAPVCAEPLTIGLFTPYIYEDGDLHSFDYLVSGAEDVRINKTVVGGIILEDRYSTQWDTALDADRVHVDVPGWYGYTGVVPIEISVSRLDGSCETPAFFSVTLPERQGNVSRVTPTSTSGAGAGYEYVPNSASVGAQESGSTARNTDSVSNGVETQSVDDMLAAIDAMGSTIKDNLVFGPMLVTPPAAENDVVNNGHPGLQCGPITLSGWVLLTLIHVALALIAGLYLWRMFGGASWWVGITILVPLLILLGLWFTLDTCRLFRWFPAITALIGFISILLVPMLDGNEHPGVAGE